MPNYFTSKAQMLAYEALASFMIIEKQCAFSINHGMIPDKMLKVYQNAETRLRRRYKAAYPKG